MSVNESDGRRIGYLRLWTLSSPDGLDIAARELATGRLKDADGVVVDLRGRWGGGPPDAAELFVGDTPNFRLISRSGKDMLANVRWRRPVVAIIDEGSRSGLELFAYALKANGIPLVGTRTAGALLAGRAYLLPDDSILELAVSDAVIDDGVRLEGRGVEPDVTVRSPCPTPTDAIRSAKPPWKRCGASSPKAEPAIRFLNARGRAEPALPSPIRFAGSFGFGQKAPPARWRRR